MSLLRLNDESNTFRYQYGGDMSLIRQENLGLTRTGQILGQMTQTITSVGSSLLTSNFKPHLHINRLHTMSLIVYQGKMTAGTYMVNENLYLVFPSGIKDGNIAYVLGTWTKDASGTVNAPLTMAGYPVKLITEKQFFIVRSGEYYHLKVDISGDKLNVVLLNERDEVSSSQSTLSVLTPVPS
ncbi:hypothetical protein EDB84DRAFT_223947 [Lactarius hengduanensis]|nr:hypothetical protein EDB84DRAFT_223947 [Lactarius hengduanensis]